ncbi:type I restriction endonuclease subunit R [Succinivibrio sp.]|uniref:type I restriction endonuclease subunit R n=1 Tax=Succinivibrio sp. TaxID=2053619 RepID=UPI00258B3100|nr:type I restriction endonuclease subunit R [Succinivibrio sp.]MDD6206516.1 type I restriction endonuclease subunit R [Succinivibrio sp.]
MDTKIVEDTYEQAIIMYLKDLGYEYLYGPDVERVSNNASDVFLEDILQESLSRINKGYPQSAINELINKIKNVDAGNLVSRNIVFTDYIQSGVQIKYYDGKETKSDLLKLIDYEHPENNSFHVVNQWTYQEFENKRPDVILFINGMPLVLFELKSPSKENVDISDAYKQIRTYQQVIPSLFVPNMFIVLSDLADTRVGTITSPETRFVHWKTVDGNYQDKRSDYRTMLQGMCSKERLLDIFKNFICFNKDGENTFKILAGYHQYFAVNKAIKRTIEATKSDGRSGVFWHTQGSGKSLSMVFYAHLIQSTLDEPTIVVITDRNDLDDQLFGQFSRCADFIRQIPVQAESHNNLMELLENRKTGGVIFTTLQKFQDSHNALSQRRNIVVMADEAHRSQYGTEIRINKDTGAATYGAAGWMRKALPNASFIGFTGTPISFSDKDTQAVFGDYIDVYDMTQAVEDGATRPVYYESRAVSLKLDQRVLHELDELYDDQLSDDTEKNAVEEAVSKSKKDLSSLDAVLGAPETIDSLCKDIIEHYEKNRADLLTGKAMIVAYSRPCAIKIYKRILELRPKWNDKLTIVMTLGNQDPVEWRDIVGTKVDKKDRENKFKDDKSKLKIAIVVDMWLTGFDVPSLSTMYVFKPMKGHNLMQAIARVNRVFKDKEGGLIVDYIGIASALKKAMNDYTARDRKNYGNMNIADTAYPQFKEKLSVCRDYLHDLQYMEILESGQKDKIINCILDAADYLLDRTKEKDQKEFITQSRLLDQAFSLAKSMTTEHEQLEASFYRAVRSTLVKQLIALIDDEHLCGGVRPKISLEELNARIAAIVAQGVKSDGVVNLFDEKTVEFSLFDESFLKEISMMKQKNLALEALKRLIAGKISGFKKENIVKSEKFSEMLQKSVNSYLNGMISSAEVIEELLKLAKEIMDNEKTNESMGLTKEEAAFYEALTRPENIKDFYTNNDLISLTRELTESLRKNNTVDWSRKESARAKMKMMVKRLLKKYKYPPENTEGAVDTIMKQCELWSDNNIIEEN